MTEQAPVSSDKVKSVIDATEVSRVAFEIFKHMPVGAANPDQYAIKCYRNAEAFLKVATKIASGELKISVLDNNPLDDCYAPNLKKTHPINLMSRQWGSVAKVREAYDAVKSPTAAEVQDPKTAHYEPLSWGYAEINQARQLFPAVLDKAKQLAAASN